MFSFINLFILSIWLGLFGCFLKYQYNWIESLCFIYFSTEKDKFSCPSKVSKKFQVEKVDLKALAKYLDQFDEKAQQQRKQEANEKLRLKTELREKSKSYFLFKFFLCSCSIILLGYLIYCFLYDWGSFRKFLGTLCILCGIIGLLGWYFLHFWRSYESFVLWFFTYFGFFFCFLLFDYLVLDNICMQYLLVDFFVLVSMVWFVSYIYTWWVLVKDGANKKLCFERDDAIWKVIQEGRQKGWSKFVINQEIDKIYRQSKYKNI